MVKYTAPLSWANRGGLNSRINSNNRFKRLVFIGHSFEKYRVTLWEPVGAKLARDER
jgi:hypothetical protein